MNLNDHGAQHLANAAIDILEDLRKFSDSIAEKVAGKRLVGHAALHNHCTQNGSITNIIKTGFGPKYSTVSAILFDKKAALN